MARPPRARGAARARARGDRARVLERPLAERGREVARHSARHGEDADAQRAASGSRASSRGSCDERLGSTTSSISQASTRARSASACGASHELLVEAGPPPELPAGARDAPRRRARSAAAGADPARVAAPARLGGRARARGRARSGGVRRRVPPRPRRRGRAEPVARRHDERPVGRASLTVRVGTPDSGGNWPVDFKVRGPAGAEGEVRVLRDLRPPARQAGVSVRRASASTAERRRCSSRCRTR